MNVALTNLAKFGFGVGVNVVYIYTAELYPTPVRSRIIGASALMSKIGAMAATYIADLVSTSIPTVACISYLSQLL